MIVNFFYVCILILTYKSLGLNICTVQMLLFSFTVLIAVHTVVMVHSQIAENRPDLAIRGRFRPFSCLKHSLVFVNDLVNSGWIIGMVFK